MTRALRAVATSSPVDELAGLVASWELHLKSERKSPATLSTYLAGVRTYLTYCAGEDVDPLERGSLKAWVASMLETGRAGAPSTAATRLAGVRRFGVWLLEEGEVDVDEWAGVKAPKIDKPLVPVLSDDELRDLVAACRPPKDERTGLASLRHRRDEAIIRVMVETGIRASECVGIRLEDVDMGALTILIRRGKGGAGRLVAIGPHAATALDRYLRVRRLHRLADTPALWLGANGRTMSYAGLYKAITTRGAGAGIEDLHPHVLRHTSTSRWLDAGGSESGAMATHGWSSLKMLERYARATRQRRAIDESRALNLGEF